MQTTASVEKEALESADAGLGNHHLVSHEIDDRPSWDNAIEEELTMEDPDALDEFIRNRIDADDNPEVFQDEPAVEAHFNHTENTTSANIIPNAIENWKLSPTECISLLRELKVPFQRGTTGEKGIRTPLFLTGPIDDVSIEPRYKQSTETNKIMDCHLLLAMTAVAKQAKSLGIKKIAFYSSYRPLKRLPQKCRKKKSGKKCRRLRQAIQKARTTPSQHKRALAIDIRWLITEDNQTIDVLEHFDRRSKKNPCSYKSTSTQALLLQKFVCNLYTRRVFNVILTPNANKAHHDHFHFDITPGANWYIIR